MIRLIAFKAAGGFDPTLIAGEEADLCYRIRRKGGRVDRINAEMTLHDANMTRVSQWWQRSVRSGYATAEAHRRRGRADPVLKRQVISNVCWALPVAWPLWPLLWYRVWRRRGSLYASNIVFGKLPHLVGQARFWIRQWRGRAGTLIEYK